MPEAVVLSTPSASTPTPQAAPATSAPSESIAPSQRPTFEQAFAADVAPVSTDPVAPVGEATIPPATPSATESATHPSTEKPQGPIPFEVHKTALENARTKATADATANLDRDYGWMRSAPPEAWQRMQTIAADMSNPPVFLDRYFSEAMNDPEHGAAVRSWAARTLATRGTSAPKAPDLSPDVTVQDADGREVAKTFSADRVQAIVQHAIQEALGKEVGPLKEDYAQRQATEKQKTIDAQQAEITKQLDASTDAVLADITDLLDITEDTPAETKDALFQELGALLDADTQISPHKAAMQLRKTRIVPALQGQAQKTVLDDLTKKAAAQGLNPRTAAIAPTHRPTSFNDPSLKWT